MQLPNSLLIATVVSLAACTSPQAGKSTEESTPTTSAEEAVEAVPTVPETPRMVSPGRDATNPSPNGPGVQDFNRNGIDDALDISYMTSRDDNNNGIPDEAEDF